MFLFKIDYNWQVLSYSFESIQINANVSVYTKSQTVQTGRSRDCTSEEPIRSISCRFLDIITVETSSWIVPQTGGNTSVKTTNFSKHIVQTKFTYTFSMSCKFNYICGLCRKIISVFRKTGTIITIHIVLIKLALVLYIDTEKLTSSIDRWLCSSNYVYRS